MPAGTHHDLIFGHEGNARAAASVILIGVIAALIGSVFMAIGPKFKQEPRATRDMLIGGASAPVRIIGDVPRQNAPCDQQVWPNFDQRCLVRREAQAKAGNTSSSEHNDKLSPLSATATTMDRQPSSQDLATGNASYSPTASQQDTLNIAGPSEVTEGLSNDNVSERSQQGPIEPPRKRARRHDVWPAHLNFGARF
jgi:hypothetical protein